MAVSARSDGQYHRLEVFRPHERSGFFEPAQRGSQSRSPTPAAGASACLPPAHAPRPSRGCRALDAGLPTNGEPRALTLTPELAALLGKELKRVHAVQRRAAQGVKKTARGSATQSTSRSPSTSGAVDSTSIHTKPGRARFSEGRGS